jgi:iron complex outermembrane receptor protein
MPATAQVSLALPLADLSIEELAQVPITSVSRRPEPLATAPSAIQVVSGEEIRRSGASLLPEALRLAPNLQVAQINSNDWSITARGFSGSPTIAGSLANKLLVMIDGRAIYSPVFGGVFWDVNNVLLDDIDRIEVVSGPGSPLWGVNAVNGVINVIRRHAAETQGLYGNASIGNRVRDYSLRHGGTFGKHGHFRVSGQHMARDALYGDGRDEWRMNQLSFRLDLDASERDALVLQGDFYDGEEGRGARHGMDGQNLMAVWQRHYDRDRGLRLAGYLDRRWRNLDSVDFETETFDLDLQHSLAAGDRVDLVWGANYRVSRDSLSNPVAVEFDPSRRQLQTANGFLQGTFALRPERLSLTLGAKFGDNEFSGFELQPGVRLAWTPHGSHLLWSAVSRAVRTPSRLDVDLVDTEGLFGNPGFLAEKAIAYELGYRMQAGPRASLSLALYYNEYSDLRSINADPGPPPVLRIANDFEARSRGVELFGMIALGERWRLRAFYTYFDAEFSPGNAQVIAGAETIEAVDPRHQFALHSMVDLSDRLQFDLFARRTSARPPPLLLDGEAVPAHTSVDARLAWQNANREIALIGQRLNGGAVEFDRQEIPRSVFLRTRFWF